MDLPYDSGQKEIFLVKIETGVLDLWVDEKLGSKYPKTILLAPDPK